MHLKLACLSLNQPNAQTMSSKGQDESFYDDESTAVDEEIDAQGEVTAPSLLSFMPTRWDRTGGSFI